MQLYLDRYGGDAIAFRPFSGYGEDQDAHYPFPAICARMRQNVGAEKVSVWGSGLQSRDFIHIEDCVNFIGKVFPNAEAGAVLNLSTGIPTNFIEMATEVCRQLGWEPKVVGTADMPEGVFFRCGDTALQRVRGLVHSISLSEGIARMLDHLAEQQIAGAVSSRDGVQRRQSRVSVDPEGV
jgi:GDP-L-fucose synthase